MYCSIFAQNLSDLNGKLMVFDIAGHYIKDVPLVPYGIVTISGVIPGAYVAKAITSSEEVSKRLIVR